jgi:hypothetical protein
MPSIAVRDELEPAAIAWSWRAPSSREVLEREKVVVLLARGRWARGGRRSSSISKSVNSSDISPSATCLLPEEAPDEASCWVLG